LSPCVSQPRLPSCRLVHLQPHRHTVRGWRHLRLASFYLFGFGQQSARLGNLDGGRRTGGLVYLTHRFCLLHFPQHWRNLFPPRQWNGLDDADCSVSRVRMSMARSCCSVCRASHRLLSSKQYEATRMAFQQEGSSSQAPRL
jgi:hypothetical protein